MGVGAVARLLSRIDAGWLFLIAGTAALSATVLVPAHDDLAEARWHRDRMAAQNEHRAARLRSYAAYLEAVQRGDEAVALDLAARQLNLAPAGVTPVHVMGDPDPFDATVFPALEPEREAAAELSLAGTALRRVTTDPSARLWVIAGGALCVLIGLLPAARREDSAGDFAGCTRERRSRGWRRV